MVGLKLEKLRIKIRRLVEEKYYFYWKNGPIRDRGYSINDRFAFDNTTSFRQLSIGSDSQPVDLSSTRFVKQLL